MSNGNYKTISHAMHFTHQKENLLVALDVKNERD
jgi:hypothetical protein